MFLSVFFLLPLCALCSFLCDLRVTVPLSSFSPLATSHSPLSSNPFPMWNAGTLIFAQSSPRDHLTPLFPLDASHSPVSPLFPLDTRNRGVHPPFNRSIPDRPASEGEPYKRNTTPRTGLKTGHYISRSKAGRRRNQAEAAAASKARPSARTCSGTLRSSRTMRNQESTFRV